MKSKRCKEVDIPMSIKKRVWERDKHRCIICGSYQAMPNAHILSRAHGGLGIETNIITLCTNFSPLKCHYRFDNGTEKEHDEILKKITIYMKKIYGDSWSIDNQRYKKN